MMHVGGYHEYTGGCSVHWNDTISISEDFSTSGGIMMHVGEQVDKSFSIFIETLMY